ncbi:MAG: SWIM zinc finger family protein [Candidatus Nanopelagicales bacterium]
MSPPDTLVGFSPFAPGRRTKRGLSWWARAWVEAMEEASLDPGRLARGRTYANAGHVGPIAVSPGRIAAAVQGSRRTPYRTQLTVQTLTDAQWDAFLDQVAGHAGHLAALLDRTASPDERMAPELVEAAADVGVPLLPGQLDLDPDCSCPDWGHPCKHAAALCYQTGWLLDSDPFVLLLMRGRGEDALMTELGERNARHARPTTTTAGPTSAAAAPRPTGTPARAAYAQVVMALPEPPGAPDQRSAPLVVPAAPGISPDDLALVVADAAARARELLALRDPRPALTEREDAARLAAELIAGDRVDRLATERSLLLAGTAWAQGGRAALEVLDRSWTPPKAEQARARADVADAWDDDPPTLQAWRNRWTLTVPGGRAQLRLGRDGRWYPYREIAGQWWPDGEPNLDPVAVLGQLLAP